MWKTALAMLLLGCAADPQTEGMADAGQPDVAVCTPGAVVVERTQVDFGEVRPGETAEAVVVVSNPGCGARHLRGVVLDGDTAFEVRLHGVDPRAEPSILTDPDGDGRAGFAGGRLVALRVTWRPERSGLDEGVLSLLTDDPAQRRIEVALVGRAGHPCLAAPAGVLLPDTWPSHSTHSSIELSSCGDVSVEVVGLSLVGGEGVLTLAAAAPFALGARGTPEATAEVAVDFAPREVGLVQAELVIETDEPATHRVPIRGLAVPQACDPVAAAAATRTVQALETVALSLLLPADAEAWEWAVVDRPPGDQQEVRESPDDATPDDPTTAGASFQASLVGGYELEGRAVGADGCPVAQVHLTLTAEAPGRVYAELTWDTPGDANARDPNGSDLDLHLIHPEGAWGGPLDCHFADPQPDWGPPGPEGDPALILEDHDGEGPEALHLALPEAGPYLLGVEYRRDTDLITGEAFGPAEARVRIFVDGILAIERTQVLAGAGVRWAAARIAGSPTVAVDALAP